MPTAVTLHRATAAHTAEVLDVLDEAAAWLRRRRVIQWPERFESWWLEEAIARGETWLARAGDVAVGTLTLDWSDPLWADAGGAAGYVHRMAVRRQAAGVGAFLLDWAADAARQNQRHLLRLDCVASNPRLRAYYEGRGFAHRGDVAVGGAPGQRRDDGPVTWVSRYERALAHPTATVTPAESTVYSGDGSSRSRL
jgi:GNAT superfamily N-acetyltransferase